MLADLRRLGLRIRLKGADVIGVKGTVSPKLGDAIRARRATLLLELRREADNADGLAPITAVISRLKCVRCGGDGCRHCVTGKLTLRGEPTPCAKKKPSAR